MRPFIVHFRQYRDGVILPTGGATVSFIPVVGNKCEVGMTICHEKEGFNRKRGVEIATGRARARRGAAYVDVCERPETVAEYIKVARELLLKPVQHAYDCSEDTARFIVYKWFKTPSEIKQI